jgi:hypothetical protein
MVIGGTHPRYRTDLGRQSVRAHGLPVASRVVCYLDERRAASGDDPLDPRLATFAGQNAGQGKKSRSGQRSIRRTDRSNHERPPLSEAENATARDLARPSVTATTPILPTKRGTS